METDCQVFQCPRKQFAVIFSAHLTLLTGARAICAVGKRTRLLRYAYLSLAWGKSRALAPHLIHRRSARAPRLTQTSHRGRTRDPR